MATDAHASLREALTTVRDRIDELHSRGERLGEQNTKATLIGPMLAALGWHSDELGEVSHEYRFRPQDNPVDYALFVFGKPCLLVEAKALGTALDRKCASQALYYAYVAGIAWCVLTNGDEYRLYCSREMGDVEEKLFRVIRLSEDATDTCIETLGLLAKERMGGPPPDLDSLWRSEVVDRQVSTAFEDLLANDGLLKVIRKKLPEVGLTDLRESLARTTVCIRSPSVPSPGVQGNDGEELGAVGASGPTKVGSDLAAVVDAGLVVFPLTLQRTYKGALLEATVECNATITCLGQSYRSLSRAGGEARRSVSGNQGGKCPATNGWTFWQYADPKTGQLRPIGDLRPATD